MKPTIIAVSDAASFGARAADCFAAILRAKPDAIAVLPTGMTPLPFYQALRERFAAGSIGNAFTYLALDEYRDLPDGDTRLFASWIGRELLDPLGIPASRRVCFRSGARDPAAEAARIEAWLAAHGPIDIAVLGLGGNGHAGFNEPGSTLESRTRMVELTGATIASNAAYWGGRDRVPARAFTLGLANLRAARHTMLLVRGADKAGILGRALTGPVGPEVPASYLQLQDRVTVVADSAALPPGLDAR